MVKMIGVGTAVAWAVPTVVTMLPAGASGSIVVQPQCDGETCETFTTCSPTNSDCVCVSSDRGGTCIPGSTPCGGLAACAASSDCPAGYFCALNTCCGSGVCVEIALTDQCGPAGMARPLLTPGGPTIGHK
jgi:hypothetical protein